MAENCNDSTSTTSQHEKDDGEKTKEKKKGKKEKKKEGKKKKEKDREKKEQKETKKKGKDGQERVSVSETSTVASPGLQLQTEKKEKKKKKKKKKEDRQENLTTPDSSMVATAHVLPAEKKEEKQEKKRKKKEKKKKKTEIDESETEKEDGLERSATETSVASRAEAPTSETKEKKHEKKEEKNRKQEYSSASETSTVGSTQGTSESDLEETELESTVTSTEEVGPRAATHAFSMQPRGSAKVDAAFSQQRLSKKKKIPYYMRWALANTGRHRTKVSAPVLMALFLSREEDADWTVAKTPRDRKVSTKCPNNGEVFKTVVSTKVSGHGESADDKKVTAMHVKLPGSKSVSGGQNLEMLSQHALLDWPLPGEHKDEALEKATPRAPPGPEAGTDLGSGDMGRAVSKSARRQASLRSQKIWDDAAARVLATLRQRYTDSFADDVYFVVMGYYRILKDAEKDKLEKKLRALDKRLLVLEKEVQMSPTSSYFETLVKKNKEALLRNKRLSVLLEEHRLVNMTLKKIRASMWTSHKKLLNERIRNEMDEQSAQFAPRQDCDKTVTAK